ncbi:MAG: 3-keto-5-aminohexanoate cleavage protein, partial [Amylibacter sp.]
QFNCIKSLIPAAASISNREMARDTSHAAHVYGFFAEAKTAVQHILYDASDIALLRSWYDMSWVPVDMTSVIYVLGQYHPIVPARP